MCGMTIWNWIRPVLVGVPIGYLALAAVVLLIGGVR